MALHAAKSLLPIAGSFISATCSDGGAAKKIAFQFQCMTWKLEKAFSNVPYEQFDISEEVQEQVELVKAQLRRATERYGPLSSRVLSRARTVTTCCLAGEGLGKIRARKDWEPSCDSLSL